MERWISFFFYPRQNEYTALFVCPIRSLTLSQLSWLFDLAKKELFTHCLHLNHLDHANDCVWVRCFFVEMAKQETAKKSTKKKHAERLTHNIIILNGFIWNTGIRCTPYIRIEIVYTRIQFTINVYHFIYLIYSDKVHAFGHDDRETQRER